MSLISADRKIASVKSEVTYATDSIDPGPPSAYQAFRAIDVIPQVTILENPRATFSASGEAHCLVRSHNDVSWEMPFSGRLGAAGTAPAWDAFMLASGFKKTVVAATSVTYKPNTVNDMTDTPSASLWLYMMQLESTNCYLQKALGYRGNFNINLTIGEEAVISGSGLALYSPVPTSVIAKPSAPSSYEGALCSVVTNLVLDIGGTNYPVESAEFGSNWTLTEIRNGTASAGTLSQVLLTRPMSGSRMGGSIRLVDGLAALQDCIGKFQTGAQATLSATVSDGTRTTVITAPALQFGQPSASAEGVLKYDVPFFLNRGTSGDDELVITLT